ncbi:MAG: hypothetical protein HYX77_09120 [Acidobacteria bacterium]|nr:hypothetical protein [Acidobacteriota bacterium]
MWGGLFSGTVASAQTFVEYQHLFRNGSHSPTVDTQIAVPGKTVNMFAWFLVSNAWGEAELGISKPIRPWLGAAVAAGLETNETPWRASAAMWASKGRFFTFFVNEYGGSGYWYKLTGTARIASRTEIGVHSQQFYGTGPLVQISLGQRFKVWASVVEGPQSLVGILKSF